MNRLNSKYWTDRYKEGNTGWDIGEASQPLIEFCNGLSRDKSILIPGAGNAYEWEMLKEKGFKNVRILDVSPFPINSLRYRYPNYESDFILGDFFDHSGKYDVILEQTFFCALDPALRTAYAEKMEELLNKDGVLAGVLFNKQFQHQGPPFGGTEIEYRSHFEKALDIVKMEDCYNSITPRSGSELFFIARPK